MSTVTGMAPDAELMALGIDCDTPSRAWEASDYALAHGAHLITQSYSWWWTDRPDYEGFRRQTDIELAAGVHGVLADQVFHAEDGGRKRYAVSASLLYRTSEVGRARVRGRFLNGDRKSVV